MKNKFREYCEMCDAEGIDLNKPTGEVGDNGAPLYLPCGFCNGTGHTPTELGVQLILFLKEQLPEIWDNLKKLK